jgi:hypothetical protein
MSTTDQTGAAEPQHRYATLIRGRVYFYRRREFLRNVPKRVTAEEEAYLRKSAVDVVTLEAEGEHQTRPKFVFTTGPTGEAAADKPISPRARRR